MTVVADLAQLRAHFIASFDTAGIQTLYDNAPATEIDETRPFVRFGINPQNTTKLALGGPYTLHQTTGVVWLQVFTPNNVGVKPAYDIVDQFVAIFRDWRAPTGDLFCDDETVRAVPNNDALFQVNVSIPYTSRS